MSKSAKTLIKMRANPLDWRIEDLEAIAIKHGIRVRKPGGSHVIFQHDRSILEVSVPAHRPIKPVYIRSFLALIDEILEVSNENTEV